MSKSTIRLALAALALNLGCFAANAAGNDPDKVLKGTWSLFVRGSATDTAAGTLGVPAGTPLSAVATVTFDGRGGCSSKDQIVAGGEFIPSRSEFRTTEECDYEVNADGTGFFDVTFAGAGVTNVTFVLTSRDELHFIANNSDLGIFGGGVMKRQSPEFGGQQNAD